MKLNYCITRIACLLLITVPLSVGQLTGQSLPVSGSSLKTSQMSDQQIQQLWQNAQKSGLSESDMMSLMMKQGMDASEIETFKRDFHNPRV